MMPAMVGSVSHVLYAAIAFVAVHVLTSTPIRAQLVKRVGEGGFRALFSLVSAVLLGWLIIAYASAPYVELWPPSLGLKHIPLVVMPFAFIFLVFGLTNPSPATTGAESRVHATDPAPGFLKVTRHPLFWGIGLWGLAHIPPNGDLASLYFFGSLALLSFIGMPLQDKKKEELVGSAWGPFAMRTSAIPFLATLQGRNHLAWSDLSWWRILVGLALYAGFLFAHPYVIGVPALPG
jgi:uncharacterized membrane protein